MRKQKINGAIIIALMLIAGFCSPKVYDSINSSEVANLDAVKFVRTVDGDTIIV